MENVFEYTKNGNDLIVDTIKHLIYSESPDLFDLLDFNNDEIFLEPLVFTYFNYKKQQALGLHQILWGYIESGKRPARCRVTSNDGGIIYLPNFGYLRTSYPNQSMYLISNFNNIQLEDEQCNSISYEIEPIDVLNNIEIIRYPNSLLDNLFLNEDGSRAQVETLQFDKYRDLFTVALQTIESANPVYFECFKLVVRRFYLYNGAPNSFAAMSAHGMAFFNIQPDDSTIFFLDNIIHQCAHVIFNAIMFEKEKWFKVSHSTPLSVFTKNEADHHDIFGRYHGLFTQTNINTTLDRCIDKNLFEGTERHELLGRFTSNMKRFRVALGKLNHSEMYTDEGLTWFNYFSNTYETLYNKHKKIIDAYRIDNQPYVFNYKIFRETNPI